MRGHHHRGERGFKGKGERFLAEMLEEKMGRVLGHGDLRFVILYLLKEKPSHGYELIKSLEEHSKGAYSPSPGVIYPTLSYLEDSNLASVSSEDNKKLYTITEEGKKLLKDHKEDVDMIFHKMQRAGHKMAKLREWMGKENNEEISREGKSPVRKAMHGLKAELYSFISATEEKKLKIAEIIQNAVEEIRKLKEEN
jgi:DNA-binding PadR family transcriptional regulator